MEQFFDPADISAELDHLRRRIAYLGAIYKTFTEQITSEIEFRIRLPDGSWITISQADIPFNLGMEVKNLLNASIDELQRKERNLSKIINP